MYVKQLSEDEKKAYASDAITLVKGIYFLMMV